MGFYSFSLIHIVEKHFNNNVLFVYFIIETQNVVHKWDEIESKYNSHRIYLL